MGERSLKKTEKSLYFSNKVPNVTYFMRIYMSRMYELYYVFFCNSRAVLKAILPV